MACTDQLAGSEIDSFVFVTDTQIHTTQHTHTNKQQDREGGRERGISGKIKGGGERAKEKSNDLAAHIMNLVFVFLV